MVVARAEVVKAEETAVAATVVAVVVAREAEATVGGEETARAEG